MGEETEVKNIINLDQVPRTDAEAHVAMLLVKVAEIGKLYHEIFYACPSTDFAHGIAEIKDILATPIDDDDGAREYFLTELIHECEVLDKARKEAEKFIEKELMNAIDEFNAACDEVKNDKRLRHQILEDEGWRRTRDDEKGVGGWTRAKDEQEKE